MRQQFDSHVTQMEQEGYTVLPGLLTGEECDEAAENLERLAAERERGGHECVFNKGRVFERIYQVPALLDFIRYFLGEDALLSSAHGSVLSPGTGGGGLHADGAITGHNRAASMAAADGGRRITSHVLSCNVIWCISDFTATNGATQVVPGSHLWETLEMRPNALQEARIVEAERGSALVFNVNTWHGSSANTSGQKRYALLTPWRRYWTRCEYEMARMVDPDVLARAGDLGEVVFGLAAQPPYLELWQWDRDKGQPRPEWSGLARD